MITFFKAYPMSIPPKNPPPIEADIEVRVSVFIIILVLNHHKRETERMHAIIKTRQNGLCYFCRTKFEANDVIVSHGYLNRHYYHKVCAEKLHII
jgi:hypothetical protein